MYGKEIKKARSMSGATQNEVSKATGLPQNTISWIELDKGIPNIQQCILLSKFYGCTLDELVGLSDNPIPPQEKLPTKQVEYAVGFTNEYSEIINDNNFVNTAKLYKAITPELRALALGYLVGLLQSNGVNTKSILGY